MGGGALFEAPAADLLLCLLAIELRKRTETMTVHEACSFSRLWLLLVTFFLLVTF